MDVNFGYGLVAHRYPGTMDRFRIPGDQGMPLGKGFAFAEPPVGTGSGKPAQAWNLLSRQDQTVRHQYGAIAVIGASALHGVQEVAGNPGIGDFTCLAVLKLLQAASSAMVA